VKTSTAVAALKANLRAMPLSDKPEVPRALPIYNDVPPGHSLFQIDDSARFEPHFHEREWVVIDTTAKGRRIIWGEVYLKLQSNGPVLWQVNRFKGTVEGSKEPHAYLDPLNVFRGSLSDLRGDCSKIVHLSDGPLSLSNLRKTLLGRVVGLFDPREFADRLREEAELERLLRKKHERDGGAALRPD